MTIEIPPWHLQKIERGEAVLFLGAGASFGAMSPDGRKPESGEELKNAISDEFLGGQMKTKSLARVAEAAKTKSTLYDVQSFINERYKDLEPADFHKLISNFRWQAIITTNYDYIVERAYQENNSRLQNTRRLIRDNDKFIEVIQDIKSVPLVKLHGCLSIINDENLPLILATEEYAKYENNRHKLFGYLKNWGKEFPIIFVGYELDDPNITQILFDIGDSSIERPEYICVNPGLEQAEIEWLRAKRIIPIKNTFNEFLDYLDKNIPEDNRKIASLLSKDTSPIAARFTKGTPSDELVLYTEQEMDLVSGELHRQSVTPEYFYSGLDNAWGGFYKNLDIERRVTSDIEIEAVLDEPLDTLVRTFLVKGYAGSGKSVTLKRVAWDAANEFSCLVLYLKEGGYLRRELIKEVCRSTDERVFLFIDNALDYSDELEALIIEAEEIQAKITIVLAARTNEWNVYGESLDKYIEKEYELIDLNHKEISSLIEKLETHKCSGGISKYSEEEKLTFFKLTADRQLLVALHEANSGDKFEKIVVNEYNNIVPDEAKFLYMDVCTLHQFDVSVRAGLISRISGISFTDFESRLLSPLEHVIRHYMDYKVRDFVYKTRHKSIAEIVFNRTLDNPESRADQIIRIVKSMNVNYSSDEKALKEIIRGKNLANTFADKSLGDRVYEAALECGAPEYYVYHQRAIYESNHHDGSLRRAYKLIREADKLNTLPSRSIKHTQAVILRKIALSSNSQLEKEKCRNEAKSLLKSQIKKSNHLHAIVTIASILRDEINDLIDTAASNGVDILASNHLNSLINDLQRYLYEGLQRYPGNEYLLSIESSLADDLQQSDKALQVLNKAFDLNPGSSYIAIRLSRLWEEALNLEKSISILSKCLMKNPGNKAVHTEYAKVLICHDEVANNRDILDHLRKAFNDGDANYDAQFWYARQNYLYGDREAANKLYYNLRKSHLPIQLRKTYRAPVLESGTPKTFKGTVSELNDSTCKVLTPELDDSIFIHRNNFYSTSDWETLTSTSQLEFELHFSLTGPSGVRAKVI